MTDDDRETMLEEDGPADSQEDITAGTPEAASITLNDAIKLAGFAQTGGQAKMLIQSGQVKVNGVVETRRKRKLKQGDSIEVEGEEVVLELED